LTAYYEEREAEFIEHTTAYVLKDVLAEFGHERISDDIVQPALKRMYTVSQAHWLLEEETIPCLEALREQGYQLAIISNAGDDADVQSLVDNTNIRKYFDLVLTSAACGIRKPNPRIFEFALERLKIPPKQAVMVGDKLRADIVGAHNAGIFSIWITRQADTPVNRDHADTIEPNAIISSLSELPELIASLAK
jgi:putative hydrolase of the HAD superfamily